MDVKKVFNHISKTKLVKKLLKIGIDGNLIRWIWFFLINQRVKLVIISYSNKE